MILHLIIAVPFWIFFPGETHCKFPYFFPAGAAIRSQSGAVLGHRFGGRAGGEVLEAQGGNKHAGCHQHGDLRSKNWDLVLNH